MDQSNRLMNFVRQENMKRPLKFIKSCGELDENKFTAAGLLHCYRKQKKFEEAFELIKETKERFQDFNWYKMSTHDPYFRALKSITR